MVASAPALDVRGLVKRFGDRTAVDGVSFTIAAGECYGLLGPNGAGKTTTVSMLCGIAHRDAGTVTVAGHDLDADPAGARGAIGFVPQTVALYPDLSARENLEFFGRLYGLRGTALTNRVDQALVLAGLADRGDEQVKTYSGGMSRRINIAAGLLHEPELLVLDEPTVGVDPQSRHAILTAVEDLARGGTAVLYTTHYMEEAQRLCDRIAILDEGRVVAEGTHRQLVATVGERDHVRITGTGPLGALRDALTGIDGVHDASVTDASGGGSAIDITLDGAAQLLARILETAERCGVVVTGVEVTEPDLEAVFLHLTGKALRD